MWNKQKISVVLPAYNEEENIKHAVECFERTEIVDEIVVVNNNSTDKTVEEASKTTARIVNESNQGYGAAMTRGLKEATGDIVITAEPDNTFIARDVFKLLSYSPDFSLVLGTRTTKELIWSQANMGWFMRKGNAAVAKMLEFLFNTCSLSDCGCTYRLIRRPALRRILPELTVQGSYFLPEMVILSRLHRIKMIEIPVNYRTRRGQSKITGNLKGTLKTGFSMIGIILRYRFFGKIKKS